MKLFNRLRNNGRIALVGDNPAGLFSVRFAMQEREFSGVDAFTDSPGALSVEGARPISTIFCHNFKLNGLFKPDRDVSTLQIDSKGIDLEQVMIKAHAPKYLRPKQISSSYKAVDYRIIAENFYHQGYVDNVYPTLKFDTYADMNGLLGDYSCVVLAQSSNHACQEQSHYFDYLDVQETYDESALSRVGIHNQAILDDDFKGMAWYLNVTFREHSTVCYPGTKKLPFPHTKKKYVTRTNCNCFMQHRKAPLAIDGSNDVLPLQMVMSGIPPIVYRQKAG